jgi:hypothetical protein
VPAATIDSATFYRRQARHLRHDLRDDPVKLHRSLRALSQWHNLSSPKQPVWNRESRTNHVQDLIAATVDRMEGPVLRYPARIALLKQAQRAGLAHFDANLIIASVQHRMGERIVRKPPTDRPWLRNLAIALIFQAWVVAGIYWLLT